MVSPDLLDVDAEGRGDVCPLVGRVTAGSDPGERGTRALLTGDLASLCEHAGAFVGRPASRDRAGAFVGRPASRDRADRDSTFDPAAGKRIASLR